MAQFLTVCDFPYGTVRRRFVGPVFNVDVFRDGRLVAPRQGYAWRRGPLAEQILSMDDECDGWLWRVPSEVACKEAANVSYAEEIDAFIKVRRRRR